jgi:hypothetical protein
MQDLISRRALIIGSSLVAAAGNLPLSFAKAAQLDVNIDAKVAFDPSSLTWVGLSLAVTNGVASALGARALGAIIGGNNSVDLDALVREFAKQVDPIVRRAIADNERDKLSATTSGLEALFMDYHDAPNKELLVYLHTRTVDGVRQAKRLGLRAVASYAVCGSLMLSVYDEHYLESHGSGDRSKLARGARYLVEGVPMFTSALRIATESRFGPVKSLDYYQAPGTGAWNYLAYGEPQPFLTQDAAGKRRADHIDVVFKSAETELLSGLYTVRDEWARIEEKYTTG